MPRLYRTSSAADAANSTVPTAGPTATLATPPAISPPSSPPGPGTGEPTVGELPVSLLGAEDGTAAASSDGGGTALGVLDDTVATVVGLGSPIGALELGGGLKVIGFREEGEVYGKVMPGANLDLSVLPNRLQYGYMKWVAVCTQ